MIKNYFVSQCDEAVDDGSESPLILAVTIKNELGEVDLRSITAGMLVGFYKYLAIVNMTLFMLVIKKQFIYWISFQVV